MFVTPVLKVSLDSSSELTWAPFARFWVGHIILKAWHQGINLNIPYSEKCPLIYETGIKAVKSGLHQIPLGEITRLKVEGKLLPLNRLTPVGKLVGDLPKRVWCNVNDRTLFNDHKDLAWQILHECLPTRTFLKKKIVQETHCVQENIVVIKKLYSICFGNVHLHKKCGNLYPPG